MQINFMVFAAALVATVGSSTAFAADPPAAAPSAAAPTAQAIDPEQQMICRREKETGSLIKSKKVCHTKQQWQYIFDVNNKFANDYVDSTRTKSGGN